MSSIICNELVKTVMNKFINNGHSYESSYLIVKYFIGVTESNISNYQERNKKEVINIGDDNKTKAKTT